MLVETTKGLIEDSLMEKRMQNFTSEDCITTATEYWHDGKLVHRSMNVELIGRDLFPVQESLGA